MIVIGRAEIRISSRFRPDDTVGAVSPTG